MPVRFVVPDIVVSDNRMKFVTAESKIFCKTFAIEDATTVPFSPRLMDNALSYVQVSPKNIE